MSRPKKRKAYEVHDEENGVIVFDTSNAAARRHGGSELGGEWESVHSCRRAPAYDQYAPGPVPPSALIEDGWWFECAHCNRQVTDSNNDRQFDGELTYCDSGCLMKSWQRQRAIDRAKVNLIEAFDCHFHGAKILHTWVGSGLLQPPDAYNYSSVIFELPGCTRSLEWRFGEDHVHVFQEDKEAYLAWRTLNPWGLQ